MLSSLLASAVVMLFQKAETYSNSGLTKVSHNNNKQPVVENG